MTEKKMGVEINTTNEVSDNAITVLRSEEISDSAMAAALVVLAAAKENRDADCISVTFALVDGEEIPEDEGVLELPEEWDANADLLSDGNKGIKAALYAACIAPLYEAEGKLWDKVKSFPGADDGEKFVDAVKYCVGLLSTIYDAAERTLDCSRKEGHCMVMTAHVDRWEAVAIADPEIEYVISPSTREEHLWTVQAVPTGFMRYDQRKPLPRSWAGKEKEELVDVSNVLDAVFCHKNRHLATAKSLVGAKRLAALALQCA